jgi:broad specificity phosphatase PhoE
VAGENQIVAYFARHGRTTLNHLNCFRGAMNPDLDATGRRQAHRLASLFEPIDLSAIFYSDKKRSEETSDIIASRKKGIQCFGTKNLWPLNVGEFSGQPKDAANEKKLEKYIQNPDLQIPGGESLNEFKARVRPCIQEAIDIADEQGAPTLCVVHSSVIHEVGDFINNSHESCLVEPGGVCAVFMDGGMLRAQAMFRADTQTDPKNDTIS